MQAAYGTESLEYPEHQSRHDSTAGFYGDIADANADNADDADASGEEYVELPNAYSRHTLWEPSYSDFSPNLGSAATVMRMGAMPSSNTPASLPLRPQAEARSMRSLKELYDNDPMHGLSVRSHWNWHELPAANVHVHAHANDDTLTSSSHFPAGKPIVFRPQPVAPHVFFKCDGMALNGDENNSSSRSSISGMAYANAHERGGGIAGHIVRDEYEDDGDSDCSGELPRFEATTAFN
ncbi:hypothetical protein H4S07_007041, partial [Coemansia furcata]